MQRVRNTIIGVMLATVLIQTFATVLFIVQFQLNRNYYAEVLCENKNRPELACKGQCVLMKRLKSELEQQKDNERQTLQNLLERDITLFYQDIFSLNFEKHAVLIPEYISLNPNTKYLLSQNAFSRIFHPPILGVLG